MARQQQAMVAAEPSHAPGKLVLLDPARRERDRGRAATDVAAHPRPSPRRLVTVLFTDIVESTSMAVALGDGRWLDLHERHETLVRSESHKLRGRYLRSTGDGFVLTFDRSIAGVLAAAAIIEGSRKLGLEVRTALHSGECEIRGGRPAGLVFHIGARIVALAEPGEILVSQTVRDVTASSHLQFCERGSYDLKGLPGKWDLFSATLPNRAWELAAPRTRVKTPSAQMQAYAS
jgi:class 3 adenylate cyclase